MTRIRNYRCPGTVAKLNFGLRGLPAFRGVAGDPAAALRGRVHVGPGIDYLERAFDASKYGETSPAPYLDIAFPTVLDASMAPAGRHVMSVHMQYAPFTRRSGSWEGQSDALADLVLRTLEIYAPGVTDLVEHRQVITPLDLETVYGLTGGHIHHGELALDQLFTMRPTLGWADYHTPLGGLYLCGSGTHPGSGLTGASGQNAAREILKGARRR
jgi:phytoene dehydrogenase-like protein